MEKKGGGTYLAFVRVEDASASPHDLSQTLHVLADVATLVPVNVV